MSYHLLEYFALFLPIVILVYQMFPQKYRKAVLLVANYTFFYMISGTLLIYLVGATIFTHYIGIWLENVMLTAEGDAKTITKKKRKVLAFGVLANLGLLIILKYLNFFGQTASDVVNLFTDAWKFEPIKFMVPIGISFYTLQIISYMTDVYRGKQKQIKIRPYFKCH